MIITAKELRGKPGQIIEQAARGTDIVITIRGKKLAKLIPYKSKVIDKARKEQEDSIFGLWSDRSDMKSVELYVRSKRKKRAL
jgi:prevent-host-death family protein